MCKKTKEGALTKELFLSYRPTGPYLYMAQSLRESPRLSKPQAEPTTNVLSHVLACMWRREIGGLFEVRCCVRSGASSSLLVLVTICRSVFAVVHRFRASTA